MDQSSELLDYYDEQGNHLGIAPRSRVHSEGLWHKTAQVWVINEAEELLLQLRSSNKVCFPNRWDISSAGHILAGALPLESALRELEEELGVCKKPEELKFLFEHSQPYIGETHIDREIAHVYLTQVSRNFDFSLQTSEVTEVRWIHFSKLMDDFYSNRADFVDHEMHFKKLVSILTEN